MRTLASEYHRTFQKRDDHLTAKYIEDLSVAAILHDIGKVGVSTTSSLKPARLTPAEFELIKRHTTLVADALTAHQGRKDYITLAREIAIAHHERWTGKATRAGSSAKLSPLGASDRRLRRVRHARVRASLQESRSHEKAVAVVAGERGKAFDPEIVDVFMKVHPRFKKIRDRYQGEKKAG